jgi:uncharacterized membrane protein
MPAKKSNEKKDAGKSLAAETESNVLKVTEMEAKEKQNRTMGEKIAEYVAAFCGSVVFVYVHIVWFGGWIIVNSLFTQYSFDPFPFTFLTLVVSLEAIFLSTFILISQNHETHLTERRNHLDLQINMLAEQESTKTLELVQLIAKHIGVPCEDDETRALLEPMDPAKLIEQIAKATDQSGTASIRQRA